jgi:glutamate racemase
MQYRACRSDEMSKDWAIGIFDSGVGGLTVVRSLVERLPQEELVYLGDTARVPYGSKSAETVARYSRMSARFLLEKQVKMIVVACNTASAFALETLRAELPVPVLGVVEPGAAAAVQATSSGHVGVLGTLGTVRSGAYTRAISGYAEAIGRRVRVTAKACPLLVPLAEEGWLDGAVPEGAARRYLEELFIEAPDLDVIVLGCTHYPLLRPLLTRVATEVFGRPVMLVDSGESMAAAVSAELSLRQLGSAGRSSLLRCYVTDDARIDEIAPRFLGRPLDSIERVDL